MSVPLPCFQQGCIQLTFLRVTTDHEFAVQPNLFTVLHLLLLTMQAGVYQNRLSHGYHGINH